MAASGCHIRSGCGYPAPTLNDFYYPTAFKIGSWNVTKPELLGILAMLLVIVFFWAAFAKPKLVPRGAQNLGELGLLFVRDQVLRPSMGKKGDGFLPFLTSLFFFIWVMNLMEVIPVLQFPVTARTGFVWPLVAMVYGTYTYLGIKHQGLWGYFKNMIPSDVPLGILPLLILVEVPTYLFFRPLTLGVRLFGNMFAGHMLLLIFTIAAWYLASISVFAVFAVGSFAMVIVLTVFELFIQAIQAFIFTVLTATYLAGSLEAAH
jgi:F-type H+-transporting ATPase subunit a